MSIADRFKPRPMYSTSPTETGFQPRSTAPSKEESHKSTTDLWKQQHMFDPPRKPIDACNCPHHQLERAHRELTLALRGLLGEATRHLAMTNDHLVNAARALEQFGFKE